jgi:CRISPR/Cas system-associated protein Csm6
VEDFTAGTISSQSTRKQLTLGGEWDARVHKLVSDFGAEYSPELIEEMIVTALRMARDKMSVADLKLISRSMKEMRYAAKIFAGYPHAPRRIRQKPKWRRNSDAKWSRTIS